MNRRSIALALFFSLGLAVASPVSAAPPSSEFGTVTVEGPALPDLDSDAVSDAAVGRPAPSITGADYTGRPVRIEPSTDGPTLIAFMAHWCSHCNVMIDRLAEWRRSGDAPKDVRVVGVSTGVQPDGENFPPSQWVVDNDWRWPLIADDADGSAFHAYGGIGLTMLVFVDANGDVAWRTMGEVSLDDLQVLVDDARAGEPATADT